MSRVFTLAPEPNSTSWVSGPRSRAISPMSRAMIAISVRVG